MHGSTYVQVVLAAFLGAVAVVSFVLVPHWVVWLLVVIGGLVLMRTSWRWSLAVGLVVLACAVGMARYQAARHDDTVLHQLALDKADVHIVGYMEGGLKQGASGWSLYVRAREVDGQAIDERLLVRLNDKPVFKYGDGLTLTGRIGRAAAFDGFDYPAYLRKEGVRSVMIRPAMQSAAITLPTARRLKVRTVRVIADIGDTFSAAVRRSVPEPASSYLVGILVGGRAAMPADLVDAFSRTSTSHVLAISGYNITILATAVMAGLAGWLGRRRAMLVTVGIIVVFVVMTGASASVVRAAIMGVLLLAAQSLGRQARMEMVMLLSAGVMVWINPLIVRDDVGFQLSFAALLGLVYLEPIIKKYMRKMGESTVGGIVAQTTAAQIAVLPLILYYFDTLSVLGPLVNVLILPLVPLAMALGFATGIIGLLVPPLAQALGTLAWAVASYQIAVVRWCAALPWSAFSLHINAQILVAMYGLVLVWWHLARTPNDDKPSLGTKPYDAGQSLLS